LFYCHLKHYTARAGHLDTVRWLVQNGCEYDATTIGSWGAQSGNIELMKWLKDTMHVAFDENTMAAAAETGIYFNRMNY
jgi:ankyrin repeat protein